MMHCEVLAVATALLTDNRVFLLTSSVLYSAMFPQPLCGATYVWNFLAHNWQHLGISWHWALLREAASTQKKNPPCVSLIAGPSHVFFPKCKSVTVPLQSFASDSKMSRQTKDAVIEMLKQLRQMAFHTTPWWAWRHEKWHRQGNANDAIAQHDPRITSGS